MKTYYHATPFENFESIARRGILKSKFEGVVFLTEKPEEAVRFLAIRFCREILVCEVEVDESLVEESFDHNEAFFKCKAYAYRGDIKPEEITDYLKYTS
ncbi:MAG: hypothetical protein IKK92_01975 [Prevotella sp.]|nr:hypothetical protein [Prevotella sp.]